MREGYHLICAGKDHIVVAHYSAAADSADPQLFLIPLLPALRTVIYILILPVHLLVDGVCQRQGCARRRIQLKVMMLLNNLDVETCRRKLRRCLLKKLKQHVYAQRHVSRF